METGIRSVADDLDVSEDMWVFGYGSLMWRPGFAYLERVCAHINGLHRSLCVYSYHHRGTREKPGLVLGLDLGGSCRGMAFRVAAKDRAETLAYLRAREQINKVYREELRHVTLDHPGKPRVRAVTYVVDRRHPQYSGRLPPEEQLRYVMQGVGESGPNCEYVIKTVESIALLGLNDQHLGWIAAQADRRKSLRPA